MISVECKICTHHEDTGKGYLVCHKQKSNIASTSTSVCSNMLPILFEEIEVPRELNHIEKRLAAVGYEV